MISDQVNHLLSNTSTAFWSWLFPATYLLHIAEEYWGGEGYSAYLLRLRSIHVSPTQFLVVQSIGLALMVTGIILADRLKFPNLPTDAKPQDIKTRVTLFVNGSDCGSRLIPVEESNQPLIQEWRTERFLVRFLAMRGLPLTIRFAVTPESDWLYGVNVSNWPEGYESNDAKPVDVEMRR